jgi:hypothetical protein
MQVIYPRLAQFPATARLAHDSLRAHVRMEECLSKLKRLSCEDERWRLLFEVLKEDLRSHIDDEEDRTFKKLRSLFREREQGEMAREFVCTKSKRPAA